jgi:hypothetical protein
MFENMAICVEISLSLDISVKYAQCVKIWIFLKCVQFSKVLCSIFFLKYVLSSEAKWRHTYRTRILHLSKGRHALWRRVSLLLNIHTQKESSTNYSPRECSLCLHVGCLLARIRQTYLCQRSPSGPAQEAPRRAQAV